MGMIKNFWSIGWQVRVVMVAAVVLVLWAVIFDPTHARSEQHSGLTCHGSADVCASYFDGLDRPGPGMGGW